MKESRLDHWEEFWKEKNNMEEVYSNSDRVVRNIVKLTDVKGKKILEIGAGTGRDSFPFVTLGAEVFQLDYSPNSLKIMKQIADTEKMDVTIIGGDTFQLPFQDETFDIIFHQGLLEHFRREKAGALLKENIRVLKTGGLLCVDVPQRWHIYTAMKTVLIAMNKWFAGWERSFSVPELKREMEKLGLTTVHIYGEWMYPSLLYRVTREALRKIKITLPLYPKIPGLFSIRKALRNALRDTPVAYYTALSMGVIGKK
ncbi:MAG: class I SAM-dependent methyltransferase [Bacteroidetes bacterium]|nr:class I SAM-dependent methyltransferase [Bacteroidota bacterium]